MPAVSSKSNSIAKLKQNDDYMLGYIGLSRTIIILNGRQVCVYSLNSNFRRKSNKKEGKELSGIAITGYYFVDRKAEK